MKKININGVGIVDNKRFKYYPIPQIILDERTGKRYYGNKAICELLNELNERDNDE